MTDCTHAGTAPVDLLTGETVALLCVACRAKLPPNWGCTECEWEELRNMTGAVVATVCRARCPDHPRGVGLDIMDMY